MKRMVASPHVLGKALCDAIGIDGKDVRSVTLSVAIGEVPTVTVETLVLAPSADHLVSVLTAYDFVEREP